MPTSAATSRDELRKELAETMLDMLEYAWYNGSGTMVEPIKLVNASCVPPFNITKITIIPAATNDKEGFYGVKGINVTCSDGTIKSACDVTGSSIDVTWSPVPGELYAHGYKNAVLGLEWTTPAPMEYAMGPHRDGDKHMGLLVSANGTLQGFSLVCSTSDDAYKPAIAIRASYVLK
jgi:hypothetical protein